MSEQNAKHAMELMRKYSQIYAMYIEYPHKSLWTSKVGDKDYRKAVRDMLTADPKTPILLYFHVPFCQKQCFYCTCHTFITNNYEKIKAHLEHLFMEIDLFRKLIDDIFPGENFMPNFKEIHLGGGSPTLLKQEDFDALTDKLASIVDFRNLKDFSIEIDPRNTNVDTLRYYHSKGINRISFGVQDFDPDVQKAVNRIQPAELIEKLLSKETRSYFHGINFDIMWGLPKQTLKSFKKTIETALGLSPDRISLLLMHYAPDIKKHQKLMDVSLCPTMEERTMLFDEAVQMLTDNGYIRIGLEHFAKPNDELAIALKKGSLHWNSLGYTSGEYSDVIAFGTGSAGTITSDYYFQNEYSLESYENTVAKGLFPVFRGYRLNEDDKIRRAVIHSLRTYFKVAYAKIEDTFNINFTEYFEKEITDLSTLMQDGIVIIKDNNIKITEVGKYFTFQACRVFDKYLNIQEKK